MTWIAEFIADLNSLEVNLTNSLFRMVLSMVLGMAAVVAGYQVVK